MGNADIESKWGLVDTEKLVYADWNYKELEGPEVDRLLESLENNFKRNGQVENILIRELDTGFFEVVNGNHRLMVAKRLGLKNLMCFNFGKITEAQAKRIAIETNETKFKADTVKLAELVVELKSEFEIGELSSTLPFTSAEIENFTNLLDFDWTSKGGGDSSPKQQGEFKKIIYDLPIEVAEAFEAQVDRFKKILYPEDDIKKVSHILPIEAMVQILHQTPNSHIKGGE